MRGKEKCEFLKGIRKRMAEANGIPYEPRECTYEGECTGTCPFCEKEAAELMAKIKEKGSDVVKTDIETIATFDEKLRKEEAERINREQMTPLKGDLELDEEEKDRLLKEERLRRKREEEYRREIEKREKRDNGFVNKVIKRIKRCFEPTLMGEVDIRDM